jgi:2-C-methyl-D-erythritol 4-phosphate cytidylyltransferase
MGNVAVILPAAGKSTRFGDPRQKKIYAELDGRAVWLRSVEPFLNHDDVAQIILAIAPEDRELFERRYQASVAVLNIQVIEGGAERVDTVALALEQVRPECDYVAIHDAARPCLTTTQVDAVFKAAREQGAALLAIPATDTLKRVSAEGLVLETVPRQGIYMAQTPQVFRRDLLVRAYAERDRSGSGITDDTQLVEAIGHPCAIVEGSAFNLKITTQIDLKLAKAILDAKERSESRPSAASHPFAEGGHPWDDLPKLDPNDLFRN